MKKTFKSWPRSISVWFCREILRYVVYRQHFVKAYIHHSVNKCKSWFLNKEIIFVYRYPVSGTELHRWELFSFSCWPYIIHHQVERNLAKYVLPGIGIDAAVIQFKSASPCYLWGKKNWEKVQKCFWKYIYQ